jgi:hypothetical protein
MAGSGEWRGREKCRLDPSKVVEFQTFNATIMMDKGSFVARLLQ